MIDVVIVTKNRAEKLLKCVSFLLANTVLPNSIIIIDSSNQKDRLFVKTILSLGQRVGVKVLYKKLRENSNVSRSRNIGMKLVKTFFFAYLDDDEYAPKNWIKQIVFNIEQYPNIDVWSGPKKTILKDNIWMETWDSINFDQYKFSGERDFICGGNTVFKTEYLRKNDLKYDERLVGYVCEDVAMGFVLTERGAKKYFDNKLWINHDNRSTFLGFWRQWFEYGKGVYKFKKLFVFPKYGGVSIFWQKLIPLWSAIESVSYMRPKYWNVRIFVANIIKDVAYVAGYHWSWLKDWRHSFSRKN